VRVRIDEAGDFDFRAGWWRLGAVAAVIVPDRSWSATQAFVADRGAHRGVRELKAQEMTPEQRPEIVQFIVAQHMTVLAGAADSELFAISEQLRWRREQLAKFEAAVRSRAGRRGRVFDVLRGRCSVWRRPRGRPLAAVRSGRRRRPQAAALDDVEKVLTARSRSRVLSRDMLDV
jgi:hypothetical protein